jgi:hypothetical protein
LLTVGGSVSAGAGRWSFVGGVMGSVTASVMICATVNLGNASASDVSISPPFFSGTAFVYGQVSFPLANGGQEVDIVNHPLF